jgi:dolichyl-phosphate-mannose--protein O-mannosyl transferase
VLFFVIVPAVVYYLSYIPYGLAEGMTLDMGMLINPEFFRIVWDNQVLMFDYHSRLVLDAVHPYSSFWWQWVLNTRPILYYSSSHDGLRSSFAAFGNPIVWWGGFAAMIAVAVRMVRSRDAKAMFILIGFLSQLLPWIPITRILFIYHYFPSTLFLVLATALVFNTILDSGKGMMKQAVYGYTAIAGVLFIKFYPGLTGLPVPAWYFQNLLRWMPQSWPFW